MKPVTIFRHIECEGPGYLDTVLKRHQIPARLVTIDQGNPVPGELDDTSGVIIMGGPMSVNDNDTWITEETRFIRQAIGKDLPVLGHCLGGQFIARALGAQVIQNPVKEIGWLPVSSPSKNNSPAWLANFHEPEILFHWHGETFELPDGATRLLSSADCENQAFMVKDNIFAFQCHIEMTTDMVDEWSTLYEDELNSGEPAVQSREQMMSLTPQYIDRLNQLADHVYEHWITKLKP